MRVRRSGDGRAWRASTVVRLVAAAWTACLVGCADAEPPSPASAAPSARPTPEQALTALAARFGDESLFRDVRVQLGTCKPALEAAHPGQVACTVLIRSPGGSSETQSDFHWDGRQWLAEPSGSQEILPFPDPAFTRAAAQSADGGADRER